MPYLICLVMIVTGFLFWKIPHNHPENFFINVQPKIEHQTAIKQEIQKNKKPTIVIEELIDNSVPFTSQAPFSDWQDERQQDGCEEASALMAIYWAQNKSLNKFTAWQKIIDISDYEQRVYGEYRDIGLEDIINRIFKDYFKYDQVSLRQGITKEDIINELKNGNLVLAPMNGQKLNNPYFTSPGPERHMLVIKGYDQVKKQFITNDPGTKRGENYRYDEDILFKAIRAYSTGYHVLITEIKKDVIIFKK